MALHCTVNGANFHGVYISQIKNLAATCDYRTSGNFHGTKISQLALFLGVINFRG